MRKDIDTKKSDGYPVRFERLAPHGAMPFKSSFLSPEQSLKFTLTLIPYETIFT